MGDTDKDRQAVQEKDSTRKSGEKKLKTINEKLRKKLEKLKKDDPNIYPVF
jgi:hypothetical protein